MGWTVIKSPKFILPFDSLIKIGKRRFFKTQKKLVKVKKTKK